MKPYQQTIPELVALYQTDETRGLSHEQAQRRLQEQGPNTLPEEKPLSWIIIFLRQFKSPLIFILLLAAAIIFFAAPDPMDAFIISGIVFLNAIIGTIQEKRAYNILESLKQFEQESITVIRENKKSIVPTQNLVVGDIVFLQEGERVPADMRIIASHNLRIDEALLTGEAEPQQKQTHALDKEVPIADRNNMGFAGSFVMAGSGKGIVVATGTQTEIGAIQRMVQSAHTDMPLKHEIDRLSYIIIVIILSLCIFLLAIGLATGKPFIELLITLAALFICVIPEGLPVILTLTLVAGAYRMARKNVLVKHLQAVEALGRTDVIVIDKTGTLTRNEMTVSRLYADKTVWTVTGEGYHVMGDFLIQGEKITQFDSYDAFTQLQIAALLLNNATINFDSDSQLFEVIGDPTEAALLVCAQKTGLIEAEIKNLYRKIYEIPFSSALKYHAGFFAPPAEEKRASKGIVAYIIGSPETVIKRCNNADTASTQALDQLLKEGLRVVAIGRKEITPERISLIPQGSAGDQDEQFATLLEQDITLLGFAGIQDAIRPEVGAIIDQVRAAGLHVVMATGDHRATALYVARQVGIFKDQDKHIDGATLDTLTDQELLPSLHSFTVFSRVAPAQKMRIIDLFHQQKKRVAMTGDGINDTPSLVAADAGIAMGRIGTHVAKQAADLVLLDDSFSSIIEAIKEGRHIFLTLQRAILYFFSTNMAEILLVLFALIANTPLPLVAAHILWINLVTDGFLDSALVMEPQADNLLGDFNRKERLVHNKLLKKTVYMALPMGLGSFFVFYTFCSGNLAHARTLSLITLSMFQWFNAWNCRSQTASIFKLGILSNRWLIAATVAVFLFQSALLYIPFMQQIFKTVPLSLADWLLACAVSSSILFVEEARKFLMQKRTQS